MNKEKQTNLFKKFPKLCEYGLLTKNESNTPIAWFGIECCDGWYSIIEYALSEIQNYLKIKKIENNVKIIQIKEKFGGLRIYIDNSTNIDKKYRNKIYEFIEIAEKQASKTCEICGENGTIRNDNWLITLCDKCFNDRNIKE